LRIAVVGTGHVGLVSCVTFAHMGHEVVGIDADRAKIETLRAGRSPFFEPGVQGLLDEGIANRRLRFTTDPADGIPGADAAFICVGTPPRESGEASLVAVEKATRDIAAHVDGRIVIVEKSTVPAGTHDRVKRTIAHERPDLADWIRVASNPEFLREGRAVVDTLEPERILVGADDDVASEALRRIYQPLTDKGVPLIETDIATAEIAKHACNAFLSMKISFINAVARMCERAGADIASIAEVMGTDTRIGASFLNAGIGYGGFCFPKDVDAFERVAHSLGYSFPLLREIARINDEAVEAAFLKVRDALWNLDDKRVCLLGLAFKPGTDDVRFAPALTLAERLRGEGARVSAYDPVAMDEARREEPEIEYADDPYGAATDAHVAVLCTEWSEFKDLDLDKLKSVMRYPIFVDGRNLFDPEEMERRGFTYYSMGRRDPAARRA
jgi:UDPglucose 6-dehydrogenase